MNFCPPIVRAGASVIGAGLVLSGSVTSPITIWEADGARERRVPETVIARPPGDKVWPPMVSGEVGFTVKVFPSKTKDGEPGAGVILGCCFKGIVLVPITIDAAWEPRLSFVPPTPIALPGESVCPATMN